MLCGLIFTKFVFYVDLKYKMAAMDPFRGNVKVFTLLKLKQMYINDHVIVGCVQFVFSVLFKIPTWMQMQTII